jgi:hypothetical protein
VGEDTAVNEQLQLQEHSTVVVCSLQHYEYTSGMSNNPFTTSGKSV